VFSVVEVGERRKDHAARGGRQGYLGTMVYVGRYLLLVFFTIVWGVPATLLAPFDRSGKIIMWIAVHWIGWIFRSVGVRVEAEGLGHIDPSQPYVIMTNHQSVLDIGALVLTLPIEWHFVAKRELTWIPLFGWAVAMSQVVIDRGNHEKAVRSLSAAAGKIRGGWNVIIFPEGTRGPGGELREFKSGGFHLALEAQVPILPATVSGSQHLTPKRSLKMEPGTIKISYGAPIPTQGLTTDDRHLLKQQVRAAIQAGYDWNLQKTGGDASAPTTPSERRSA
jgi:1-acyl-sn-glycerol-3-phosphate acyltransferase